MIAVNLIVRRMGNNLTDGQRRRRFAKPCLPPVPRQRGGDKRFRPADRAPRCTRAYYLARTYGLTIEDVDAMIEAQGRQCAACGVAFGGSGKQKSASVVDHCHASGRVRGMLCNRCNAALGQFGDDPRLIAGLLAYAEKHASEKPHPRPKLPCPLCNGGPPCPGCPS